MSCSPRGCRVGSWEVAGDRQVVAEARETVRGVLAKWGMTALVDDAVLGVSELLSNAVIYGEPPIRLSIGDEGDTLLVRVADRGPLLPERIDAGDEAERGRGLVIVEAIADEWGVEAGTDDKGKVAWFRLATTAGPDGVIASS